MRQTIGVRNAREHNLKDVSVEIPRDKLVVFTGLSGSGKSSLAFDTIYAEGQRRFLESLSAFSKRFVQQLTKPNVEFIDGLSPVVAIEQKTVSKNPRSTVGTMTDVYDYVRLLYCTVGVAHCPVCRTEIPAKTPFQIAERILSLPRDTQVELCAPVRKIYGEDWAYLFAEVRAKGCRRIRIDGVTHDLGEEIELDEDREYTLEAVTDKFNVQRGIDKSLVTAIEHGLKVGDGFLRVHIVNPEKAGDAGARFTDDFACPQHGIVMGETQPYYFSFNEADSACTTCLGLGTNLQVHPDLLVPDKTRSIKGGAFVPEAFKPDKNSWGGRLMWSLAAHQQFDLDAPFETLPPEVVETIFYGTKGDKFPLILPEGATKGDEHVGKTFRFNGIINDIERRYRHYKKQGVANTWMEDYLRKVMVEYTCPDCKGTKLKPSRLLVTIADTHIHDACELSLSEFADFMARLPLPEKRREAGRQVVHEISARLELLIGVGLDYLSLSRKSATLAGGEAQRIRLSTQIGSGLMGMLYVLDEPSIGLHARDNVKMIATLRRLRDLGNTVFVVEHDEETIRAADWIVEMGPGPGVHGGEVVAAGPLEKILKNKKSLTGKFLNGIETITVPEKRRPVDEKTTKWLTVRGARENNLRNVTVSFPLGVFICVTGVSGSGKSTLVNEILYKKLVNHFHDSRVLSGAHDGVDGLENIRDVIAIDQSPIGRVATSNPATYTGLYDTIRQIFAATKEAIDRNYTASRFSFNVKGGRCEECGGQGVITTSLQFMPDVEVQCQSCKGKRYNADTLEVTYRGKTISDVLDMPIEEARQFFDDNPLLAHKLDILCQLGLGYLTLGQSSTTISGGEAQRVKLAHELGKIKRGGRNFYILDEPTTGLHLADIQKLLDSLNRLVDAGHTVLVIEHHLDVIKTADWVIDLGPDGGKNGGLVMVTGTPEVIVRCGSHTGRFLKDVLENERSEGRQS